MTEEFRESLMEQARLMTEVQREVLETFEQAFGLPSDWQGFRGIAGIFDEYDPTGTIWAYWDRPKAFTPAEFNKLWDGFTKQRRIDYVLSLIT